MRVIVVDRHRPDILELRWMWLPTFVGQNQPLLAELGREAMKKFPPPYEATEEKLDEIHDFVIDWLTKKVNVEGFGQYLRAIESVVEGE